MAFRRIGSPSTLTHQENNAAKTRLVTGDGTGFLRVPGLIALIAVAVATANGRMELPLTEDRLIMVHQDQEQPRHLEVEDLFELDTQGYDSAILLRSELSNGGIWQKGVDFYITGEWEDPAPTDSLTAQPTTDNTPSASTPSTELQIQKQNTAPQDTNPQGIAPRDTALQGTTPQGQTPQGEAPVDDQGEPSFTDSFDGLTDDLKAKIAQLGSLDAAQEAMNDTTNEKFKAVGIAGPDILRARNALGRVLAAQAAAANAQAQVSA